MLSLSSWWEQRRKRNDWSRVINTSSPSFIMFYYLISFSLYRPVLEYRLAGQPFVPAYLDPSILSSDCAITPSALRKSLRFILQVFNQPWIACPSARRDARSVGNCFAQTDIYSRGGFCGTRWQNAKNEMSYEARGRPARARCGI